MLSARPTKKKLAQGMSPSDVVALAHVTCVIVCLIVLVSREKESALFKRQS